MGRIRRKRYRNGEIPAYVQNAPHRHGARMARKDLPRGLCRVCEQAVASGRRGRIRSWHDGRKLADGTRESNCLHRYKVATRPSYAKRVIATRDGRVCRLCKASRGKTYAWLHLDHITPLADGGTADEDNLQLICPDCHRDKTAAEATARAARRRLLKDAA